MKRRSENIVEKKPEKVEVHKHSSAWSFLEKFLFMAIGCGFTILANQLFFKSNKKFESGLSIKEQNLIDAAPVYRLIVNFAANERTHFYTHYYLNYDFEDTSAYSTIGNTDDAEIKVDSMWFMIPTFVIDSSDRADFLHDIEQIKKAKDKLDKKVWQRFADILDFLDTYPLPPMHGEQKMIWGKRNVLRKWDRLTYALFEEAYNAFNEGWLERN